MAENFFVARFQSTSEAASHPSVICRVDDDYKLIGGGAVIDPVEPSNFLTASYPLDPKTWFAAGKDHEIISPASITADAIASPLYVPNRAKENGAAACKQKGKCKSIACHLLEPSEVTIGLGVFNHKGRRDDFGSVYREIRHKICKGVEEFHIKFATRCDAQVCLDRVRLSSQLRKSDTPGAIQTNSSGRRRG